MEPNKDERNPQNNSEMNASDASREANTSDSIPESNNSSTPTNLPGNEDLQKEGIDIVGTGMALDNELMKPEEHDSKPSKSDDEPDMSSVYPEVSLDEEPRQEPQQEPASTADSSASKQPSIPVEPLEHTQSPAFTQTPTPPPAQQTPPQPTQVPSTPQTPPMQAQTPAQSPVLQNPTANPATVQKNQVENDPSIKQIRTFKTDAEEAVKSERLSTADIAIAAAKKREKNPIEYDASGRPRTWLYMSVVIAAIVILGGGWYVWFSVTRTPVPKSSAAPVIPATSIITFKKASVSIIPSNDNPISDIATKLGSANPGAGNVYMVVPVASSTSTAPLGIEALLGSTHAPDRLLRSLADVYMVGSYENGVEYPFLILKDTYFQNAYSGMLDWEANMRNDLLPLVQVSHPGVQAITMGSDAFADAVVTNVNARVLKDSQGEEILTYAFADNGTIVITTSTDTLRYILRDLLDVRTIQ